MESEVAKTKRKATEVMEKYKTYENFAAKKAQAMADFQKSEFYALCRDFGQESSEEGFNKGT